MATTDELLAAASTDDDSTDSTLVIDWDTREITIPDAIPLIGVENDKDSNRLYFKCPATYGEFDISKYSLRVCFGNYEDDTDTEVSADIYIVDDVVNSGGYLTFSWLVGENAYTTMGYVNFIVCCKYTDSSGNVVSDLNTTLASLPVLEGRDCNIDEVVSENYSDLYATLVALQATLTTATASANTAASTANTAASNADTATAAAQEATEEATAAAESANTAASAVYTDRDFLLLLNDDGSLSLTYDDGED